ncbi:MAG: hypothetical protein ACKO6D_15250 [Rubrivivax sp.]
MHLSRGPVAALALGVPAALLSGCSPALDWREVRPQDTQAQALLPCRPASHAREVSLAGQKVRMVLHACRAGDTTWALAWAELGDPARTATALAELRTAAAANVGAAQVRALAGRTPGETPNPESGRYAVSGRLPDGQPVQGRVALAARGAAVMQATALGPRPDEVALDTFFDSLRLR